MTFDANTPKNLTAYDFKDLNDWIEYVNWLSANNNNNDDDNNLNLDYIQPSYDDWDEEL